MRSTNNIHLNFFGPNTFKGVEIVGHTHKYTRIQELIVWHCVFLKYTHKLQDGMHLATQDAHLLNFYVLLHFYDPIFWRPLMPSSPLCSALGWCQVFFRISNNSSFHVELVVNETKEHILILISIAVTLKTFTSE